MKQQTSITVVSFADQGKQIFVSVCSKHMEVFRFHFLDAANQRELPFSVSSVFNISTVHTRCVPNQTELPHYLSGFSCVKKGCKINNLNEYIFSRFC
jgi:hypothetical protein